MIETIKNALGLGMNDFGNYTKNQVFGLYEDYFGSEPNRDETEILKNYFDANKDSKLSEGVIYSRKYYVDNKTPDLKLQNEETIFNYIKTNFMLDLTWQEKEKIMKHKNYDKISYTSKSNDITVQNTTNNNLLYLILDDSGMGVDVQKSTGPSNTADNKSTFEDEEDYLLDNITGNNDSSPSSTYSDTSSSNIDSTPPSVDSSGSGSGSGTGCSGSGTGSGSGSGSGCSGSGSGSGCSS